MLFSIFGPSGGCWISYIYVASDCQWLQPSLGSHASDLSRWIANPVFMHSKPCLWAAVRGLVVSLVTHICLPSYPGERFLKLTAKQSRWLSISRGRGWWWSALREEDLTKIRRKFSIPPSVELRCPTEFELAPDGGTNEIAILSHTWRQVSGAAYLL